ncbi:unnamed protein product [Polarella glacialis]|uniref:Uncharacterized protein n=1 Tax=Polarella glacialis TaxID=89957 RepID=A0A813GDG3_POLGL|nr:unnamed protein product [Polarella glacialis]
MASSSLGPADVCLGLLSLPQNRAADLAAASEELRRSGVLPGSAPLLGLLTQASSDTSGTFRLLLARGEGSVAPFFVNKEELSQAGAGLAKENPVPGVPDGKHASLLLFADPKVPGALTRNLLEALDARYPTATKAGLVVLAAAKDSDDSSTTDKLQEWEPPRERRLRTRDRSDGHGWVNSDPIFDPMDEAQLGETGSAEFKKRPFGVKRYTPGYGGKGAMVMDMMEKGRYKGDAMGQAADSGIRIGSVLTKVGDADVRSWDFEDIMDLLADQGIMDPDSKSAATWGDGGKDQRKPVEPASLPVSVAFAALDGGGSSKVAPLCVNGVARRDGVIGVALSEPLDCMLALAGCRRVGPTLDVAKAGVNPEGGFVLNSMVVQGKEMPAASALKGVASSSGLQSMKGVSVGVPRPQSLRNSSLADLDETASSSTKAASSDASSWAVFPMVGVTKQGGLVLRCKGLSADGLGRDEELKKIQFFAPFAAENGASAVSLAADLVSEGRGRVALALATSASELRGLPSDTLGLVGAAVIGAAGAHRAGSVGAASTVLHRQATAVVAAV